MSDPIEIMARAVCFGIGNRCPSPRCFLRGRCTEDVAKLSTTKEARAAIAAIELVGYRLAEREPTKEQVKALRTEFGVNIACRGWRHMWDALPKHGGKS